MRSKGGGVLHGFCDCDGSGSGSDKSNSNSNCNSNRVVVAVGKNGNGKGRTPDSWYRMEPLKDDRCNIHDKLVHKKVVSDEPRRQGWSGVFGRGPMVMVVREWVKDCWYVCVGGEEKLTVEMGDIGETLAAWGDKVEKFEAGGRAVEAVVYWATFSTRKTRTPGRLRANEETW